MSLLDKETLDRFLARVQTNPEWLQDTYFPALERLVERYHTQLHQANRAGDLADIKYRQGCLDGAAESLALVIGLRSTETKKPAAPGLLARIYSFGGFNARGS